VSSRSPSEKAAQSVQEQIARAEARGAEEVRAEIRRLLDDRRRIVRMGDQQIEVIEVSALDDLVSEPE
jgi:F0F1-type ATP synthase membrane subunit b/b'